MLANPTILVATDFSESSDYALRAAERLRQRSGGKIHAIHVTPYQDQWDWLTNEVVINYYPEEYKEEMMMTLQKKLKAQLKSCDVSGEGSILVGPSAQKIIEFTSSYHPDLVIMGHKGKESHFYLGDVTAKVVAALDRPVLVVNKEFNADKIVGLVDPLGPEKSVFNATEELGFLCSGEVEFISLWPDQTVCVEESFSDTGHTIAKMTDEKRSELKKRMEKTLKSNIDPHSSAKLRTEITPDRKIRDGIIHVLQEEKADLAVMTKHHKGKLEKFFLGSVTRGVLDHWRGNLLVIPG